MKTFETYFGLEFGEEFPLDQKTRRQLARLLFANPKTSPEEAIRIIRNFDKWSPIDILLEFLQEELKRISQIDLYDFKEPKIRNLFFDKSLFWIKAFSCPTPEEIIEVALIFTNIPEIIFFNLIERVVSDDSMPPQKIIDYLTKYSSILPRKNIDALLDLYNLRMVAESSSDSIQLKFQMQ